MATYVDLDLLKAHVYADDITADDELLDTYLSAAEQAVITSTRRTAEDLLEQGDGSLPLALRQAVLLLAGMWYMQREAISTTSANAIPYGIEFLVRPYRRLV